MKNTADILNELVAQQAADIHTFKPLFYKLGSADVQKRFDDLLRTPGLRVSDFIHDHLKELVKFRNPSVKFSTNELLEETKKILNGCPAHVYGLWVYYPWSNRLVHIPDREDFIDLRTSRNQYKITRAERDVLAQKKIGVIGLSVGQSVSVTLAMERVCGELRLADFDVLELTNLNRIRTGIHNLGLPKVYSVAREIAEIDPFIEVVCYPQGLSEDNLDAFFTDGGKLDLLIEESDGFDIKILSRYKARSLGVPVVMEGSDRCAVDVERFDLEPQRSILHGLVDHLDVAKLKTLKTNEEKIPYMLDMLGIDTASQRLKASMLEIEQSINTWPQLASSVTMGGGITADVARRLLLNHYTESGRYHVDIEELIGNRSQVNPGDHEPVPLVAVDVKSRCAALQLPKQAGQVELTPQLAEKIVTAGCLAPSGGNIQPWRWAYHQHSLLLFNAFDLQHTLLGYANLPSYVALGAAIENVRLQAATEGLRAVADQFPVPAVADLVAVVRFFKQDAVEPNDLRLASAIGQRLTNRSLGPREAIAPEVLDRLRDAALTVPGFGLRFFSSPDQLDTIADVLGELERIRLLDKTGHRDFVEEIRWSEAENARTRDGVDLRSIDLSATERVGMEMYREPRIRELLNTWKGGGAFRRLTKKSIDAAGAVGLLTIASGSAAQRNVDGGIALERVWLEATLQGLAFQPVSASVYVWARLQRGGGAGLEASTRERLATMRPRFETAFALEGGETEFFIFRLSKAADPQIKALRKPIDEIFCYF